MITTIMARLTLLWASIAVACDYILHAMPGDTNIWRKVQELDPVQSPYVLCLTGSSSTKHFIMDDSAAGCVWATSHLVITSLCEADLCVQQTLWLKGQQTCSVTRSLTFVNVTLSGRHYFTDSCEEGQDWCTHWLDPELLVEEQGAYFTVIEHHYVQFDASYQAWQDKCLWDQELSVFEVSKGATLSIEDSTIADVRNKAQAFVWLDSSILLLVRSQVLRLDLSEAFIENYLAADIVVLIQDCWVTGLNRDHVYAPDISIDGDLLYFYLGSSLTIVNSSFTDLIMQDLVDNPIICATIDSYHFINTTFARCVGYLLNLESSLTNNTFDHVVFEANYAPDSLIDISDGGTLNMVGCSFLANQCSYGVLSANLAAITSGVFRNNRLLTGDQSMFIFAPRGDFRMENTVFEENKAMDGTFEPYWSDYYLAQGLLTDTGLSTEKATMQSFSTCYSVLKLTYLQDLSLVNVSITDTGPACDEILHLYTIAAYSTRLQLTDVLISSQTLTGVDVLSEWTNCIILLQNCLFEWARQIMTALAVGDAGVLVASNVTFQYAHLSTAAVELSNFNSTFLNCRWYHNQGRSAGGLLSLYGTVTLRDSYFLNNSCWSWAGDVSLKAGNSGNVTLQVSSCTFTASNSSLNAASILVTGVLVPSSISNCTFSQSSSSSSVLKATHNSGSLLLSSLTFLDITAPSSLLILVTVPAPQAVPARTTIQDLQVRNCTFYRGLATKLGEPLVDSRGSNFTGNSGALIWIQSGQFSDFGSVYLANTAPSLCFFGSQTVSSLNHSQFRGNSLSDSTGLLYVEGPQAVVSLQDCEITGNVAQIASGIVQLQVGASVVFTGCHFSGNWAQGSLFYLQDCVLGLQYCTLSDTWDPLQLDNSTVQVLATSFNHTYTRIGSFALVRSTLTLQNVSFSHIQGTGNCLLSALTSSTHLTNVSIQDLTCTEEGVLLVNSTLSLQSVEMSVVSAKTVFSSVQAELELSGVHLTQCSAPVLSAQTSSVTLSQCEFASIHTQQEAVLTCLDCSLLSVLHSVWNQLSAQSRAISVSASQVTIRYCSFANISASDTGALQVSATSFQLSDCSFSNVTATGPTSHGGALCLSGGNLSIVRSSFVHCRAWTGGAVQWLSGNLSEQANSFRDNTAGLYGPDWASFSHTLHTSSPVLSQSTALLVSLVDHFGQVVLTDSSSQATLSANQSSALGGRLQAIASSGQFLFDEFSVFAAPGSTFTITVSAVNLTLNVSFVQRACEVGQIETNRGCERCQAGTFSLELHATQCAPCPDGAECRNGNQLFPKPGYWRPQLDFPGVLLCPWPAACVGHSNYSSQTGVCAGLYGGRLCQNCGEGGCRSGRDRCVACPHLSLQAGIVSVGLPVLWTVQALARTSNAGTLLRLLVDYLQLTVLVVDYDFYWPQPLQDFYSLYRYLGNALQAFLPLDCLYSDAFFVSTVSAALAPLVIAALFLSCWGALWLAFKVFRCSATTLRGVFINAMVVGVAYVYPFLVRVFLSAFLCETIQTKQWLRADLAVACWDKRHVTYALAVSLPSLLLWGLGLPALASVYLVRRYYQSGETGDFLSGGFKAHSYLWEVGVCLFKAVVAALYVFTAEMLAVMQALTLVVALAIALLLQSKCHPYKEPVCNRVALLSLAVVGITAYVGASFSTSGSSLPLVILVLGLHVWVFLLWMAAVWGARCRWLLCLRSQKVE